MIVCHCEYVNDTTIAEAVRDGAGSVEGVTERCGAGGQCGGCVPTIEELLIEHTPLIAVAVG